MLAALDRRVARAESWGRTAGASAADPQHHTWHFCAAAYALIGARDKALVELRRCAELGLPNYRLFQVDPNLRPLHSDPRFNELMSDLRREHDSIRDEFGLSGT